MNSYTIVPSDCHKYIIHTIVGEMARQTALEQSLEAHALGKKLNINKFLKDVTQARNTDSILNNYELMNTDIKKSDAVNHSAIFAVLISPDDHSHDFIETVAKNAVFLVKFFTDRQLAINFLLK